MCTTHVQCTQRPEEGVRFPLKLELIDGFEPLFGDYERKSGPFKSNKCPEPSFQFQKKLKLYLFVYGGGFAFHQ